MKSILDPSFPYVSSVNTDLRKTFARIRREQKRNQEQPLPGPRVHTTPDTMTEPQQPPAMPRRSDREQCPNVTPMAPRKARSA